MSVTSSGEGSHQVQFYDEPAFLADRVATFLGDAVRRGGMAIAVARGAHRVAIEGQLRRAGLVVDELRAAGRIALLDAEETLATFTRDGKLVPELFHAEVGGLIASSTGTPIHVFGEMVDVLWADGRYEAVVQLERLWGELLGKYTFRLMCGYQLAGFESDASGFDTICHLHDSVTGTATDALLARSLTQLEQRARALELEVERRKRLEDRMRRLLELTGQLSAAKTPGEVARIITETGMAAVGAAATALWVLSPDKQFLELASATATAPRAERYDRIPVDADLPLTAAFRDQQPIFLGSLAEYASRFPTSFERIRDVALPQHTAFALLPVIGDDGPIGALCLTYDTDRVFGEADRAFKMIVARHGAVALERAHIHEQERLLRAAAEHAQAETELLYQLTSEVSAADDLDSVYQTALRIVELGTRSDRSAILLFDPDGVMRFKASHGLSDRYRAAVEGHSPWKPDAIAPQAICVDDVTTDPAWAAYGEVFAAEGIGGLAFVPLVYRRKLVGKFMLYRNRPRPFASREIQLAATVAFHVGEAIARKTDELALATALADEKLAHEMAEEATRAREEIISVVSHDLRNPLSAILLGASALLQIDTDRGPRSSSIAGRIHRQAERMARLIEDLVDFAGIQAGQLALSRTDHRPDDIIHAATDMFSPMAAERGLTLATNVQADLPAISCDSERAIQVISNLVSNALKVTPKGGHITIGTENRDTDVVFFVRDDGPGIDDQELPKLFERYWRGKTSQYRGAGLGLSIARGIVDAHGGRIWAESKIGSGSTFYFSLCGRN